MTVAELMQRSVRTVRSDASVAEAVVCFADGQVSALPVVDGSGRVIGFVSRTAVTAAEADIEGPGARRDLLEETAVLEIMTPHPHTVSPSEHVGAAARRMLAADAHCLLVIEDERVIGVISTTDIVRAVASGELSLSATPRSATPGVPHPHTQDRDDGSLALMRGDDPELRLRRRRLSLRIQLQRPGPAEPALDRLEGSAGRALHE